MFQTRLPEQQNHHAFLASEAALKAGPSGPPVLKRPAHNTASDSFETVMASSLQNKLRKKDMSSTNNSTKETESPPSLPDKASPEEAETVLSDIEIKAVEDIETKTDDGQTLEDLPEGSSEDMISDLLQSLMLYLGAKPVTPEATALPEGELRAAQHFKETLRSHLMLLPKPALRQLAASVRLEISPETVLPESGLAVATQAFRERILASLENLEQAPLFQSLSNGVLGQSFRPWQEGAFGQERALLKGLEKALASTSATTEVSGVMPEASQIKMPLALKRFLKPLESLLPQNLFRDTQLASALQDTHVVLPDRVLSLSSPGIQQADVDAPVSVASPLTLPKSSALPKPPALLALEALDLMNAFQELPQSLSAESSLQDSLGVDTLQGVLQSGELQQSLNPSAPLTPSQSVLPTVSTAEVSTNESVSTQAFDAVRQAMNSRRSELILNLNPEHLGSLRVSIVHHQRQGDLANTISATLMVDSAEAKKDLDTVLSQLHERLQRHGIHVDKLDIIQATEQTASNQSDFAFSRDQRQPEGHTSTFSDSSQFASKQSQQDYLAEEVGESPDVFENLALRESLEHSESMRDALHEGQVNIRI